jgi:voltage-gated potassium channel Kch
VDAFYFTVVTITTLGYGDIVPQGDLSKIFTVFYALTGIVLLFASAQKIGETIIDYQLQKYQERRDKNNSETG